MWCGIGDGSGAVENVKPILQGPERVKLRKGAGGNMRNSNHSTDEEDNQSLEDATGFRSASHSLAGVGYKEGGTREEIFASNKRNQREAESCCSGLPRSYAPLTVYKLSDGDDEASDGGRDPMGRVPSFERRARADRRSLGGWSPNKGRYGRL